MGAIHAHAALLGATTGGGGGAPVVPDLFSGGRKGFHITPRDWSTVYQSSGFGAPLVDAIGQTMGLLTDISGNENTRFQAESYSPTADIVAGVPCANFSGANKVFVGNDVSRTASMDLYVALRIPSLTPSMLIYNGGGNGAAYVGLWEDNGSPAQNVSGSPSYMIDGVAVSGTTCAALWNAIKVGEWQIFEVHNLDMAGYIFWGPISFGYYNSTYDFNGYVSEMILCESTDAGTRTAVREYLAANNGVTL